MSKDTRKNLRLARGQIVSDKPVEVPRSAAAMAEIERAKAKRKRIEAETAQRKAAEQAEQARQRQIEQERARQLVTATWRVRPDEITMPAPLVSRSFGPRNSMQQSNPEMAALSSALDSALYRPLASFWGTIQTSSTQHRPQHGSVTAEALEHQYRGRALEEAAPGWRVHRLNWPLEDRGELLEVARVTADRYYTDRAEVTEVRARSFSGEVMLDHDLRRMEYRVGVRLPYTHVIVSGFGPPAAILRSAIAEEQDNYEEAIALAVRAPVRGLDIISVQAIAHRGHSYWIVLMSTRGAASGGSYAVVEQNGRYDDGAPRLVMLGSYTFGGAESDTAPRALGNAMDLIFSRRP